MTEANQKKENKDKKREDLFERTRRLSVKEGAVASAMIGIGDNYIVPYALELKATNLQTGLISSLANLFSPLAQILGSHLMARHHRKKIVLWSVVLQATSWFLFIILGLLFLKQGSLFYLPILVIISFVIYSASGSLSGPAWFSLMGDVVPENIRGKYFSWRNRISGIASVTTAIFSAGLLYYFSKTNIIYGFIILFVVAALSRYVSAYLLKYHYVEEIDIKKEDYFSFWRFLKKIPKLNFNRFALFISLMNFAVNIAGPFFAVYMWKELKFNPIEFTAVNLAAGVFTFLLIPLWGRFCDKYGNREALRLATILVIPLPIFWLFSQNVFYLMFVPQLISGLGWSGFNLAASNFIYDSVEQKLRGLLVAYYNFLNGIGIFLGATLGGILAQYVSFSFINIFLFIFIISAIARLLVALLILPQVAEVKTHYHPRRNNPLGYLREIKPIYSAFFDKMYPLKIQRLMRNKKKK